MLPVPIFSRRPSLLMNCSGSMRRCNIVGIALLCPFVSTIYVASLMLLAAGYVSAQGHSQSHVQNANDTSTCTSNVAALTEEIKRLKNQLESYQLSQGGGAGILDQVTLDIVATSDKYHDVVLDLQHYTGLTLEEVIKRLSRQGQFHFTGEHKFWSPRSATELAWYYRGSASYLFANAAHEDVTDLLGLTPDDAPVLDYAGGVGNTVLGLAERGIEAAYLGVGALEADFARFRVEERGLGRLVRFLPPLHRGPDGARRFDPARAVPAGSFRTILLLDVLEHIPDYHLALRHLIAGLAPGGRIFESSPFGDSNDPFAVHVRAAVPLEEAMAGMRRAGSRGPYSVWERVS